MRRAQILRSLLRVRVILAGTKEYWADCIMEAPLQALILDMDGVVTQTSHQHAAAWKEAFDPLLQAYSLKSGTAYQPFDAQADYLRYVDGKPRRAGIISFLEARAICLTDSEITTLAEAKSRIFARLLREQGVKTYRSTMRLLQAGRQQHKKIALVTSSQRGREILADAGISADFDLILDGTDIDRLGLAGKPDPDMFVQAAQQLGVVPAHAVVIEDAVAGVQAGKRGGFGLVIGVNRGDNAKALKRGGADVVVSDLKSLSFKRLERAFRARQQDLAWQIEQIGFDQARERQMESLFCIGNGYLGVRGALDTPLHWSQADLFVAGIYDKKIADFPYSEIEFMAPQRDGSLYAELVPLPFPFRVDVYVGDLRLVPGDNDEFECERRLDMRRGIVHFNTRFETSGGRKSTVRSRRCASLAEPHLLLQELNVERENHWCDIRFSPSLVEPELEIQYAHLHVLQHVREGDREVICYRTQASLFTICVVAIHQQQDTRLRRACFVYTSRDSSDPVRSALDHAAGFDWSSFESKLSTSARNWSAFWHKADIRVPGHHSVEQALRFGSYHLHLAAPKDPTVSIGARTLSGRAYEGHIFWDTEIFMFPFFLYTDPSIARNLLLYRHHTLEGARRKAKQLGYAGACFAWESTVTGDEVTPKKIWLKSTGREIPIFTGTQQVHVSADVAYAVWRYWEATADQAFLEGPGAELLFETARFWKSRATFYKGQYHIREVVGPDEYHHSVNDNAYTNWMAHFNLQRAAWLARTLGREHEASEGWEEVARLLYLPSPNQQGVIEQFEGFFALEDYSLEDAARFQAPISRLYNWDKVNRLKLIKQADVLMLFLLFPDAYDDEIVAANYRYYEPLTDHGSSLSPAVHAAIAARLGWQEEAERYWKQSLWLDLSNVMNNSMLGVHAAAMAGSWSALIFGFLGVHFNNTGVYAGPYAAERLPDAWSRVCFELKYRGREYPMTIVGKKE